MSELELPKRDLAEEPVPDYGIRLVEVLEGTTRSVGSALEELQFDCPLAEEEALELLADENLERCPECETWVEAGELVDAGGNDRPCYNCRPGEDEDGEA